MSRARAGRSSYLVGSDLAGIRDPGAVAVAVIFTALARGRDLHQPPPEVRSKS
jgi:dihydroxyacetone kinase